MNSTIFKIDGEQAKAIAVIEAEMDAFSQSVEQQYTMLNDKIKHIIYKVANLSVEQGNEKEWHVTGKYYKDFGFYMAEMQVEPSLFGMSETEIEQPTNTRVH